MRTGKGRIYKYRLGPPVGRLNRFNPFTPDQALPLTEMTDYLTTLVGATLPPLMLMLSTRNDLADWMQANPSLCGRAGLTDLLAQEVAILRST